MSKAKKRLPFGQRLLAAPKEANTNCPRARPLHAPRLFRQRTGSGRCAQRRRK
jgi:hypothetical protein